MSKSVLWLDNDPPQIEPYVHALRDKGVDVTVKRGALEAEEALSTKPTLVIVDVMVPTKTAHEEQLYPPSETDMGFKTGLLFFKRNGKKIEEYGGKILIMTVRLDKDIYDDFISSGLPPSQFATKFSLREVPAFLSRVLPMIGEHL